MNKSKIEENYLRKNKIFTLNIKTYLITFHKRD